MSSELKLIAMCPQDVSRLPLVDGLNALQNVSDLHTEYLCARCGEPSWIGPEQRKVAESGGGGEAACYYCVFAEMATEHWRVEIHSANPDVDRRPRKFKQ